MSTIDRDLRLLKIYSAISTLVLVALMMAVFKQRSHAKFEELDVERINVVEKNGQLKIVISNEERQHPGIVDGVKLEPRHRPPGLIFFNGFGDETGGLVFGEDGDMHGAQLSFDKVKNDQTVGLLHLEGKDGHYQSGLEVWQEPSIPNHEMMEIQKKIEAIPDKNDRLAAYEEARNKGQFAVSRLFVGHQMDNSTEIVISDSKSNPRIKMGVGSDDVPYLNFYDGEGRPIHKLVPAQK